ncbi:MAG: hypothetical protein ACYSTL_07565, partial [Planctomycetota bacterium]
ARDNYVDISDNATQLKAWQVSGHHNIFKNNIFNLSRDGNSVGFAPESKAGPPANVVLPDYNYFYNTTCFDNGSGAGSSRCIHIAYVEIEPAPQFTTVKNTMMYADPRTNEEVLREVFSLPNDTIASNNDVASSDPFIGGAKVDGGDFQITSGSDADGTGVYVDAVLRDFGGRLRDSSSPDLGAWAFSFIEEGKTVVGGSLTGGSIE